MQPNFRQNGTFSICIARLAFPQDGHENIENTDVFVYLKVSISINQMGECKMQGIQK